MAGHSLYRALHKLRHGNLHRALGVSQDSPIPEEKLSAATHSENPHVKKMAVLARTMKSWHH
jgi:hypothetical protein